MHIPPARIAPSPKEHRIQRTSAAAIPIAKQTNTASRAIGRRSACGASEVQPSPGELIHVWPLSFQTPPYRPGRRDSTAPALAVIPETPCRVRMSTIISPYVLRTAHRPARFAVWLAEEAAGRAEAPLPDLASS